MTKPDDLHDISVRLLAGAAGEMQREIARLRRNNINLKATNARLTSELAAARQEIKSLRNARITAIAMAQGATS